MAVVRSFGPADACAPVGLGVIGPQDDTRARRVVVETPPAAALKSVSAQADCMPL
jgi:hypothetical protein